MSTSSRLDEIHAELCQLSRSQAQLDRDIGRVILRAYRHAVHRALGYASFREYSERFLGWNGRQTEERLRVALVLEDLPRMSEALAAGMLTWSAVRELTRVATPETEVEWLAASSGRTAREIERLVSGRSPGARPDDPAPPEAERRSVMLNLSASSYALFEDLRRAITVELGSFMDDDALVSALAGKVLSSSNSDDAGRSHYQIAIQQCERCNHAERIGTTQTITIEPAAVNAAQCDAQQVSTGRASQTIPPRIRRMVLLRHGKRCAVPGCKHSAWVDVHHVHPRVEGGTHDPDLLIPLCSAHHKRVHEQRLVIRGTYSAGFIFEHTDGKPYGALTTSPSTANKFRMALTALISLGYKTAEAQRMLDTASPHVGVDAPLERIMSSALRHSVLPTGSHVRETPAMYRRVTASSANADLSPEKKN